MLLKISNVFLRGISTVIPHNVLRAEELADISERDLKRMVKSTGFEQFRIAEKDAKASDYCVAAAEALIERTGISREKIDAIVFVSQTPDHIAPATSAILQSRLGLRDDIPVFDINHGCPGYVYGLFQSAMLVKAGLSRVLLCTGDTVSSYVAEGDRSTRFVFGDGGAATFVEEGMDEFYFSFYTDGSRYKSLWVPAVIGRGLVMDDVMPSKDDSPSNSQIHMDGAEIMTFSLEVVPSLLENFLQEVGISKNDVDIFALHQANKLIIETIARKMKLSNEKMPFRAGKYGNTSLVSIPLLLSDLLGDKQGAVEKAVLCGFGVGLAAAAAYVPMRKTDIMRYIEV